MQDDSNDPMTPNLREGLGRKAGGLNIERQMSCGARCGAEACHDWPECWKQ
jgi:hypothetical protein